MFYLLFSLFTLCVNILLLNFCAVYFYVFFNLLLFALCVVYCYLRCLFFSPYSMLTLCIYSLSIRLSTPSA